MKNFKNIHSCYTDAELDNIFDIDDKKVNSFASLAPLVLHEILRTEHMGKENKISQKKLVETLEDRYELKMDRRALSRILYTLQVFGRGVVVTREGVFWDPYLDEYAA